MNRVLILPVLLLTLLMGTPASSADFQKGLTAYNKGDYATALREFRPLAEEGNANAQVRLGMMYNDGTGVQKNYKTAVKWFRLAAEQGYANAQSIMGLMYDRGTGVPLDHKTAAKWYRLAAKQGFAVAQTNLGVKYESGQGVQKDYELAVKWYRLAAEQGDADAQHKMGWMYGNGWGVPQDNKTAVKWYKLAAEQGYANAQSNLGVMYGNGWGVPQDHKIAAKWYRLAAKQGNALAQGNLGLMYNKGQGVPQNNRTAVKWLRLAAKQGYALAQYSMGVAYQKGLGVPQDYKTAVKWWRLAAKQGFANAQYNLGVMYGNGWGVPQDNKTAVKWYRLAAKQGSARAQTNLGFVYESGLGVPQDYKSAVKWYRLAAEQGTAVAQYNLGRMYSLGMGVLQDNVYAHMWFNIAASSGEKNAFENRDFVAKRMTPSQLAKAQNLARNFVPKKNPQTAFNKKASPKTDKVVSASSGSGFAVSTSGHVITNHHVIEGCQNVKIHHKDKSIPASVVTFDPRNDLALLKGDFRPSTVLSLSNGTPELLQDVYVAGYPFGRRISTGVKVTKGIISSLTGIGNNFSQIQIDAALQPGNSGGPIMDDRGNVVGVAVAKLDIKKILKNYGVLPENTNFGIKTNVVRSILESSGVSLPSATRSSISKSKLGKMIADGTYYLSCWMTTAQIEKMRSKKVIFQNLD